MIVGVGIDIAELERISQAHARHGVRFAERVLTVAELALLPANATPFLASRFAAKEAAVKALGTGFSGGITFRDVEVRSDELGKPSIIFHNAALERCRVLGVRRAHLSLSHSRENAVAVVILEA